MWSRLASLLIFLIVVTLYLILPVLLVQEYFVPEEKKKLFAQAALWKSQEVEVLEKVWEEEDRIWSDPSLNDEQKQIRLMLFHKKLEKEHPFFQEGRELHQRLLKMGLTFDLRLLTAIYFLVGILLFWVYRRRAKTMGVFSGKLQYTLYLFCLSILIIITTFGLGFAASYLYDPTWWMSQPTHHMYMTPLKYTPYIVSHFVFYALNVAAMGPFDLYMTVRPASFTIALLQWLERIFVISVLFSSISRLWWRPYSEEGDPTIV